MAALTCDICGGNLTMNESGEFAVCESCGMKHDKRRVQVKVQEITGVVEVTKGEAEKERLLNNAETFINLNEEQKAIDIYRALANDYPGEYRGWYGLAKISIKKGCLLLNEIIQNECETSNIDNSANTLIRELQQLHYLGEKLKYLNNDACREIEKFDEKVINASKGLSFLNPISMSLLRHYKDVCNCSIGIQNWANTLAQEYIIKYESGEISTLVWHYRLKYQIEEDIKQNKIYSCAGEFCLHGLRNAETIKKLPLPEQKRILLAWGVNDVNTLLSEHDHIYFALGKNVSFYSGYGEFSTVRNINRCITETNIDLEIKKALSADTSHICGYCGGSLSMVGFCNDCGHCEDSIKENLCEKLKSMLNNSFDKYSLFLELLNAFNKSSYIPKEPWKNPNDRRTYSFSKVTTTYIDLSYTDVEKGINITGLRRHTSSIGSIRYSEKDFKKIYLYMLRRKGKCQHCGSSFSGFFNKQCSKCGKPKDY